MDRRKGAYLGTEIDEKCWKRYKKEKLLARGNGQYWYDEQGFYFWRYLTKEPIFIPFSSITEAKLETKHAGRWYLGNLIVKPLWTKDGLNLSSGFLVSKNKQDAINLKDQLQNKI